MKHLLLLLMLLCFGVTNGVAAPMALCQHADAQTHAAALVNADVSVSSTAEAEEMASVAAEKQGSLADAAAKTLATALLPRRQPLPVQLDEARLPWASAKPGLLPNRESAPLLDPPLA